MIYEWLAGERPFHGSVTEVLAKQLSATPPPLPETVSLARPRPAAPATPNAPAQAPKRGISRRKVLMAGGAVVGLAAVGISVPTLVIPRIRAANFKQEVKTGQYITDIHVGRGFDGTHVVGETDTFNTGDEVFVVYGVKGSSVIGMIAIKLIMNDNPGSLIDSKVDYEIAEALASSAQINDSGIYKWEIDYNGTLEASITFQVV